MGSVGVERLAAETRLEGVAQRRVCQMRSFIMIGWPTVAMGKDAEVVDESAAVWRMWVCGTATVIIMRRGGYGDRGAVAFGMVSEAEFSRK